MKLGVRKRGANWGLWRHIDFRTYATNDAHDQGHCGCWVRRYISAQLSQGILKTPAKQHICQHKPRIHCVVTVIGIYMAIVQYKLFHIYKIGQGSDKVVWQRSKPDHVTSSFRTSSNPNKSTILLGVTSHQQWGRMCERRESVIVEKSSPACQAWPIRTNSSHYRALRN